MNLRSYHRWISTVGMVLLAYIAITGTILTVDELFDPSTFAASTLSTVAPAAPAAPAVSLPGTEAAERWLAASLRLALAAAPGVEPAAVRVQLRMEGNAPVSTVSFTGAKPVSLRFNPVTGEQLAAAPPAGPTPGGPRSFNAILQSLHDGDIIGDTGQYLVLLTALLFVAMAVTGIVVYFQMYGARRRIGRRNWFWR